ncbi:MAG: hypothetical protein AVDCRST_MAG48-2824, partial [uncultured Friedmanniella sp.]
ALHHPGVVAGRRHLAQPGRGVLHHPRRGGPRPPPRHRRRGRGRAGDGRHGARDGPGRDGRAARRRRRHAAAAPGGRPLHRGGPGAGRAGAPGGGAGV